MRAALAAFAIMVLAPAVWAQAPAYVVKVKAVEVRGAPSEAFKQSLRYLPEKRETMVDGDADFMFVEAEGPIGSVPVLLRGDRLEINNGKDHPDLTWISNARITVLPQTGPPGPLPVEDWGRAEKPNRLRQTSPGENTVRAALEAAGLRRGAAQEGASLLTQRWPSEEERGVWYAPLVVSDGSATGLAYFEHDHGKVYRRREMAGQFYGATWGVAVSPRNDGLLDVDLLCDAQTPSGRKPLKGTRLEVGEPEFSSLYMNFRMMRLEPNQWTGCRMRQSKEEERHTLFFMRVSPTPVPETPPSLRADMHLYRVPNAVAAALEQAIVPWDGADTVFGETTAFREAKVDGVTTTDLGNRFAEWLTEQGAEAGAKLHMHFLPRVLEREPTPEMDIPQDTGRVLLSLTRAYECMRRQPPVDWERPEAASGLTFLDEVDPRILELLKETQRKEGKPALVASVDAEATGPAPDDPRIHSGLVGFIRTGEGATPDLLNVDFAWFDHRRQPDPTGLQRLWKTRTPRAIDKAAFHTRMDTALNQWTGLIYPLGTEGERAVVLFKLSPSQEKTLGLYETISAPSGQ